MKKKLLTKMIMRPVLLLPLMCLCFQSWAQQVTGVVKAEDGEPLPGVSVLIEGTATGTTTNVDGTYRLNVPNDDAVLVYSFIGFIQQRISVGSQSNINVTLAYDVTSLDEVVITGYGGAQKKRDVTAAISSVSAEDIAERQPINVFDALQGQAAGIQINTDPRPGGDPSIRIRGTSTFRDGVNPLYIVDGVPVSDIGAINPADIQSLEVLKDAASAAIYGSRSANGVIIITTKRGVEGRPRIEVSYNTMLSELAHKLPQATANDRRIYDRKRGQRDETPGVNTDSLNPAYNADNDYQDMVTRIAKRHQLNLSMSGASSRFNYYASGSYLDDQGLIKNSWAKQVRARLNMEYKASDYLTFGNRLNFSYEKSNFVNEGSILIEAFKRYAYMAVRYPDGTFFRREGGRRNPLAVALLNVDERQEYDWNLYNYININLTEGLKFTSDFNLRTAYRDRLQFEPKILEGQNEGGFQEWFDIYWMQQNYLNYDKVFGEHTLNAVVGFTTEKWVDRNMQILGGNQYVSESVLTTGFIQNKNLEEIYNEEDRNTMVGMFGRLSYNYKGRYLMNAVVRRDGSSRFGEDNRWGYFPSGSVGWRFSDEPFMDWASGVLDDGKFRASYGETGNQQIGNYNSKNIYDVSGFYNGVLGVAPIDQLGNPVLGWETTRQMDIGVDLTFINNRVSITADYYKKTTSDLLTDRQLPTELGYDKINVNIGSVENEGFEFSINTYPVRGRKAVWNASYFMGFNKNRALELPNGVDLLWSNNGGTWLIKEGGALGDFYGYKSLGVYSYNESNAYSTDWQRLEPVFEGEGRDAVFTDQYLLNGEPYNGVVNQMKNAKGTLLGGGDMIWHDDNKDGVIDADDRVILGNAQPKFTAGLYNQIDYKGFSLSFNIYVQWGNKLYDKARYEPARFRFNSETPDSEVIHAAWEHPGDVTWMPSATGDSYNKGNTPEMSSVFVEDGSFIRLRNARLTYNVPQGIAEKVKLGGIRVYVYGNNLLTWTNYFWYDPEIPLGSPLNMGLDPGRSPRSRQAGIGLNVNF